MEERQRSGLIGIIIVGLLLAVGWDMIRRMASHPTPPATPAHVDTVPAAPDAPPPPTRTTVGTGMPSADTSGPGILEQAARADIRRRIRDSYPLTYLRDVVGESSDSMLHRWDDRAVRPIRVFLASDTIANFRPVFLDAIRAAFSRWGDLNLPVRFDLSADSSNAEVHFLWRVMFPIDRTGETDLEWDHEGHLQTAIVTISTFDPHGRPLGPDDVRVVALHEIGHLIGLDHSPDSTDLMFAKAVVRDLSQRDVRTAQLLYQLAPGSLR
ncbi:MAG TPA: matrixin family metalloprotease [Gemmatimonadales bacterium]|nr:matrixin family metalloprotease [Gemmatimonadales bacterium]